MSFALIIVGIVLLVTAVRGTSSDLFALVQSDFIGPNNFIYWMAAILIIGAIGYIPKARPVSTALLVLVLAVLFLKNANSGAPGGGFFAELTAGLASTQTATPTSTASTATTTPAVTTGNTNGGYISAFPALSNLLDKLGVPGAPSPAAPITPPFVSPNPSLFPPPLPGTAPEPTLGQLGATNITVQ